MRQRFRGIGTMRRTPRSTVRACVGMCRYATSYPQRFCPLNAYLHTREQNYPIEHVLVPVVSLPTLLQDEPVVDLVNFDCQVLNAPPVSLYTLKPCIRFEELHSSESRPLQRSGSCACCRQGVSSPTSHPLHLHAHLDYSLERLPGSRVFGGQESGVRRRTPRSADAGPHQEYGHLNPLD